MVTEAAKENVKEALPLTVLYDGACPLCRREIGVYRGLQPDAPVCFADVSDTTLPLPPGLGVALGETDVVEELYQRHRQVPADARAIAQFLDIQPPVRIGLRWNGRSVATPVLDTPLTPNPLKLWNRP